MNLIFEVGNRDHASFIAAPDPDTAIDIFLQATCSSNAKAENVRLVDYLGFLNHEEEQPDMKIHALAASNVCGVIHFLLGGPDAGPRLSPVKLHKGRWQFA